MFRRPEISLFSVDKLMYQFGTLLTIMANVSSQPDQMLRVLKYEYSCRDRPCGGWGVGAEDARELCVAIIATPLSS